MAKFLTSTVFKTQVNPDQVIAVAGSGAVMDIMSSALLNPSDAYICMSVYDHLLSSLGITPCYNAFSNNFGLRNNAVMYMVDTTDNK